MDSTISSLSLSDIFEINVVKEIEPALKKQFITSSFTIFDFGEQIFVKNWELFFCVAIGLWVISVIDFVIEYSTSNAYSPVLDVADSCRTGAATNVILGLALGYKAVIILIFTIVDVVGNSHLIRERTDTLDATRITTDLLLWFLWRSLVPL
ncbi:hypothetical protein IFM89_037621 [Coptis chinensis]|uniref:H(+)-exporting diphosphatase n=1 Tax=Coptis chinensis TaxID=261450 RepID=A0A835IZI4_9MAGN|nr:hypothetical protein IFM89_037621 [Coptis chinensis]